MQLFSRNKALAALSLGALAALGACGDDVTVPAPVNPPVAVTISPSNANVAVGGSLTLAVSVSGGTTTPDYACSVTPASGVITVAKVAGGCSVTGVAPGNATVIATAGTASAAAAVTVQAPSPAISGIAISPAAQNLQVGGTVTISANPTTTAPGATVARNFVSSNTAVATVNATSGVVTAVAPGTATITVTLTGTGTGLTQAVVSGQVAITVSANPPSVTGVSVNPASAAMIVGGAAVTGTATATAATGITPTFSAGSSNPGVATATVTSAGAFSITAVGAGQAVITITAQSAGNASFSAASATAQIPVTVNAAPQISIADITNATNLPVDINSVNGQIQVSLNLNTNNNVVSSVRLFVCDNGVNCTATAQPAAQQLFGSAGAANGTINMFINTADFTVASDWSSASTRFTNGQKNLIAVLNTGAASNANSNLAILNFNNADGFAARHVAPARAVVAAGSSTSGANGLTYYGGPGNDGRGTATIVPVIYTAGRTITSAIAEITGAACSGTDMSFTGAGPWTITYGASADTVANRVTGCSGTSTTTPDLGIAVLSAVDNAQNNVAGLPTTSFRTNSSNSPAVTAPAIIRGDYQAPSGAALAWASQNGASNNWVNGAFKFDSAGTAGSGGAFMTRPTDGGSGLPAVLQVEIQGCPWVDRTLFAVTWTPITGNTGANVNECAVSNANNVYETRYIAVDRLGNTVGTTGAVFSGRFGVDKTAPVVRYGSATAAQQAIITAVSASTDTIAFQIEALDERSGLNATPANAGDHYLVRASRMSLAARAGECTVGSYPSTSPATTNAGGAFITAPNCVMGTIAGSYAGITADGFSRFPAVSIATDAYYTYRARVRDEAGNLAVTDIRNVLLSKSAYAHTGSLTADQMIAPINAAYTGPFTGTFKDSVETRATGLRIRYTNGGSNTITLGFPLVSTTAVTFDNTITRDSVASMTTPFASGVRLYTNLEYVNGADSVIAAPATVDTVAASGIFALNFGGKSNSNFASFLTGSVSTDATAWLTKSSAIRAFFMDTLTISAYNAPATGLRARVRGSLDLANSPFARVDFYRVLTSGTWEFVGSVTANSQPCISASATCDVYIAENVSERTFTYVLRTSASGAESFAATQAGGLGSGSYRAIGVGSTAGRGLVTRNVTFGAAPALRR